MPLHIAQHKSYHPYNRENIERVRRDEEEARGKQDDLDERAKVADAEARVALLRRRRDGGGEHEAEAGPSSSSSSRAMGEPSSSRGREASSSSKGRGKREADGGHEAMGVYLNELEKDGPAWYGDPHLKGPKDRRKTDEQRLEDAYRDSTLKSSHDPLTAMSSFLAQREEAKRQKVAPTATSSGREGESSISSYKHYVHSAAEQDFRERPQEIDPGGETSGTGAERADATERAPTGADNVMTKILDDTNTNDAIKKEEVESGMEIKTEQSSDIESIAIPTPANDPQSLDADASMSGNLDTSVNEMADTSAATSTDSALEVASTRSPFAGESMYPTLLGEMIDVVLGQEAHLFDEKETAVLGQYAKLPYDARYLFSRLIQRKDTWHRLESLRQSYSKEISDIEPAVASLVDASAPRFLITHEDASTSGQEELLGLLTLDELKTLAKRMQANKPGTTKASIIAALLTTRSQGTLGSLFAAAAKKGSSSSSSGGAQLSLGFNSQGKKSSQSTRLANEVTKLLGVLVRVDPPTRSLIDRVAFVFYRGSMLGGTALTTAVLSRSRRRNYPRYATQRSTDLFESRAHLLAYEEAIAVENEMEELLQWGDGSEATFSKALTLFETVWPIWKKTVEDFDELEQQNRLSSYHRMRFHAGWPQTRVVYKGATILARFKLHAREEEVLQALLAQRHFRRGKRGEWYDRLALITAMYSPSLPGKPEPSARTTKQVQQAKTAALQIAVQGVEDPDTHLIYHDQLQRRICRLESQLPIPKSQKHDFSYAKLKSCAERTFYGVRLDVMEDASGATIDVASGQTLLAPLPSPTTRSPTKASADDADAGATPPQGSRFQARAPLRKIVKVERQVSPVKGNGKGGGPFAGMKRDLSSSSDLLLAPPSPHDSPGMTRSPSASSLDVSQLPEAVLSQYGYETARKERRTGMHSVWRGDDGAPCRVEELVLQRYAREGYEGRHDEGGLLKMLFALCMWDILFASGEVAVGEDGETIAVTDVFETPYQRAPLDLSEDSFAVTRAPLIRRRLALISSGGAPEIVAVVDARERPRATWAVGCRWDAFSTEDLVEVAGLIPGAALATVFQMMCEEWGHCSGGMPDLIVWRRPQAPEVVKKEEGDDGAGLADAPATSRSSGGPSVKLCEVKGPGDKLSETQKVWIDVLLRAGLHVEVSLVREGADGGAGAVKGEVKKQEEEEEDGFEVVGEGKSSEPFAANKKVKLDKETKSPSPAKKRGGWFTRGPPKKKG